ncbi:MAG: pilin [Candidatus Saccharimonadales bacterium]|nr:pilin [Candidatus Saccharimonadales bacterium]
MLSKLATSASTVVDKIVDDDKLPQGIEADNTQIDNILQAVFAFAGFVSLVFVVIGGFRYVTSGGDPQKTAQAKDTILYSIIGLVIALSAFVIVRFAVGQAQGGSP